MLNLAMDDDDVLDLEVDVNGEEAFMVNKGILSAHSRRFEALLYQSKPGIKAKVLFNDFPGGAPVFELVTRFCYNGGKINITPHNICHLISAAHFLEMNNKPSSDKKDLCELLEESFKELHCWAWPELIAALKHCQELQKDAKSMPLLDNLLENIAERIVLGYETSSSPSISSSDSSVFRLSCDSSSLESPKDGKFSPKAAATWWFKDLAAVNADSLTAFVGIMLSKNFDGAVMSKFLFYYQKSKFGSVSTTHTERIETLEIVVDALRSLEVESVSYIRSLFRMLRVARNVNPSRSCTERLEHMIGLRLDRSTPDDLLIPSRGGSGYKYDVDLILRLVEWFVGKGDGDRRVPVGRLRKAASLMDSYLAEVAPDPQLKPSKFSALVGALPGSAREFDDGVYFATSIYLKVHSGLSEEQKKNICLKISYEKLSPQALDHLMHNPNFPSKIHVRALIARQDKLKSLLQPSPVGSNSIQIVEDSKVRKGKFSEQIVIYAKKFNFTDENEKLRARLQGMQWRVAELENVCRKMQVQMANMMRSRLSGENRAKSVPRICS